MPVRKYTVEESESHPDFLKVKLQIIKEGENLNESNFLLDGMKNCKDSFKMKPLLCSFPKPMFGDVKIGDAHNSKIAYDQEDDVYYYSYLDADSERCVGFIPHDSNITIEEIGGVNWICLEGLIWSQYHFELVKDIKKKKRVKGKSRVSVEIEVEDSYEENGIEYLKAWRGLGITILNDNVQEAIVGANLIAYEQSDKYEKYKLAMSFAYSGDKLEFMGNQENLGLNKEEDALIKEKYSKEGYVCFAYDEASAFLIKEGRLFSHPLFAEEKEIEFAEAEVKEMETMAKVGTEDDGKTVKMSVEEHEEMKCKMDAFEKEKIEMESKVEEMRCHAEAMEKEKAEMAEKLAEFEKAVEEEKTARFKQEFEDEMEDEEELEEDEKKEMAEKFKKGEYASIIDVKKDIAFRIYTKRPQKKESFSVKINTEQKSKAEPKDIFETIKELTNKL